MCPLDQSKGLYKNLLSTYLCVDAAGCAEGAAGALLQHRLQALRLISMRQLKGCSCERSSGCLSSDSGCAIVILRGRG